VTLWEPLEALEARIAALEQRDAVERERPRYEEEDRRHGWEAQVEAAVRCYRDPRRERYLFNAPAVRT
jgi:hypothetical protein